MQKHHVWNMQWKNMVNKVYLDTNIFIDLLDSTRPYSKTSWELVRKMISEATLLAINSDTVTNAFYILSKHKIYSASELLALMKKSVMLFDVVAIEQDEVLTALSLCEDDNTKFKDYEDALQYVCAKKIAADLILTNDKGFVSLDIEVSGTKT